MRGRHLAASNGMWQEGYEAHIDERVTRLNLARAAIPPICTYKRSSVRRKHDRVNLQRREKGK